MYGLSVPDCSTSNSDGRDDVSRSLRGATMLDQKPQEKLGLLNVR